MKVTFAPGYEPSVDFVVEVEQDGAKVCYRACDLIQAIAALAIGHHPFLFSLVQRSVGEAPSDPVRAAYEKGAKDGRAFARAEIEKALAVVDA